MLIQHIKNYYHLTKPGIIRGNLFTGAGGFLFASQGSIDFGLFVATLAAIALIIASACVCNNYIDRNIDKRMKRTKNRALVTGEITPVQAFVYAGVLGVLGFGILGWYTNTVTWWLGVFAFLSYVVLYGIAKRRSPIGTLVGSLPGAMSITAGYTAVTGSIDTGAALLFLTMIVWQMPHFYAIATYRIKEYKAAGLPVLPIVHGIERTKRSIVLFIALYVLCIIALFSADYAGWTYLVVMLPLSLYWLWVGIKGFSAPDAGKWAGKVFGVSLIILTTYSVMISLTAWLP